MNWWLGQHGYEQVQSSKEINKQAMSALLDDIKERVNQAAYPKQEQDAMTQMDPDPFAETTQEEEHA